ncbi:MAG: glutathione peroxidase [Myxococcota bacterium]
MASHIDYSTLVHTLNGEEQPLSRYEGKVLLVVNTASQCGFTPQYKGLEELYQRYRDRGLEILGFPCNQFGRQEPGSEADIASFCEVNFGVSFPMHSKIKVNGPDTHPLYRQLKRAKPGLLGTQAIKWNFTKFLVGRDGVVLKRYGSTTTPQTIQSDIEAAL